MADGWSSDANCRSQIPNDPEQVMLGDVEIVLMLVPCSPVGSSVVLVCSPVFFSVLPGRLRDAKNVSIL